MRGNPESILTLDLQEMMSKLLKRNKLKLKGPARLGRVCQKGWGKPAEAYAVLAALSDGQYR